MKRSRFCCLPVCSITISEASGRDSFVLQEVGVRGMARTSQIKISRYEGCENRKFSAHSKSNFVFVPSPKIMNAACCPNYLPAPSPIIISILQNLSAIV